jgi:presenilin-like A22 family membrane protease
MKYEWGPSIELFLWAIVGVVLTALMVPAAIATPRPEMHLTPGGLALLMFAMIVVGMVVYIVMSKLWSKIPMWVRVMLGLIGLFTTTFVVGRLILTGFAYLMGESFIMDSFLEGAEAAVVGMSLWGVGVVLSRGKELLLWTTRFVSFGMVMAMSTIAATFGIMLSLPAIIGLLIAIALYDVIAVWKMKTMQKMAKDYMLSGWFFGVVVPRPTKSTSVWKSIAFLGGGDIFFLGLVTATLMVVRPTWVLPVAFGMLFALGVLMVGAE